MFVLMRVFASVLCLGLPFVSLAQCAFSKRSPERVEVLQQIIVGASARTYVLFTRTMGSAFLVLPATGDSITLALTERKLVLPSAGDEGFALTMDDLGLLRSMLVDTITIHAASGPMVMPLNDRESQLGLRRSAGCAVDEVLSKQVAPGTSQETGVLEDRPGTYFERGGRAIATGAVLGMLGSAVALVLASIPGGEVSTPLYLAAGSAVVSSALLISGGVQVARGGQLMQQDKR